MYLKNYFTENQLFYDKKAIVNTTVIQSLCHKKIPIARDFICLNYKSINSISYVCKNAICNFFLANYSLCNSI